MPGVYELNAILQGGATAQKGYQEAVAAQSRADYMGALTAESKLRQKEAENEMLRDEKRREGLQARAGWIAKWAGRDPVDDAPQSAQRIMELARRGPIALGMGVAEPRARAAMEAMKQKQADAERVASMMAPEDAAAFLADQEAERREEKELLAKESMRNRLANLARRASGIGMKDVADTAEEMAALVEEGGMTLDEAEGHLIDTMGAIAQERKRQRLESRANATLEQLAAESPSPSFFEELQSDMEAGFITPEQAIDRAKRRAAGLDNNTIELANGKSLTSRTDLTSGQGRSTRIMPPSAKAEAHFFAEGIASEEAGWDSLSLEQQHAKVASKMLDLMRIGGWEVSEEDEREIRGMAEASQPEGQAWGNMPEAAQEGARQQLVDAVMQGASPDALRAIAKRWNLGPEDIPPEVQDDLAAAKQQYEARGSRKGKTNMRPGAKSARNFEAEQALEVEGADQNRRRAELKAGAAQRGLPAAPGQGPTIDPEAMQRLIDRLKGGGG